MKELTPEQIQHNWGNLRNIIDVNFSGERLERLNEMYDYFEERMMLAPASGKEHFHNAHPGGYVEHVLHITDLVVQIYDLWGRNGATIDNFDKEELIFAALHHDLGKVGDLSEDYYTPNDSDWHRKNQGKIYNNNPDIPFMMVPDRTVFLLQEWGIKLSYNEYIGIKLHDGVFDDSNKPYLSKPILKKDMKLRLTLKQWLLLILQGGNEEESKKSSVKKKLIY